MDQMGSPDPDPSTVRGAATGRSERSAPQAHGADDGGVPAPALAEVSQIWWDVDRVPVVVWDDARRRFDLVDPDRPEGNRLHLALLDSATDDPEALARVLAEGLASCDFPPSDRRAAPGRVNAALRAARRGERVT